MSVLARPGVIWALMPDLDPGLDALLAVQAHDNTISTLRHRMSNLVERKTLDAKLAEIAVLDREAAEAVAPRRKIELEQKRFEDEASLVRDKADAEEKKLYSGTVSAVKELQALQEEVTMLRKRASSLDDSALEMMVQLKPFNDASAALAARREALEAEARVLTVAAAEAESGLAADLAVAEAARTENLALAPADAVARYTKLRQAFGGSAVVRLVGQRCEGCPLAMPAMEADRIRRSGNRVENCDECGRIVVH